MEGVGSLADVSDGSGVAADVVEPVVEVVEDRIHELMGVGPNVVVGNGYVVEVGSQGLVVGWCLG